MNNLNSLILDLNILESYLIEDIKKQIQVASKLTEMEKKALQKAEKDIENGDILSEEEANTEIKNWL